MDAVWLKFEESDDIEGVLEWYLGCAFGDLLVDFEVLIFSVSLGLT